MGGPDGDEMVAVMSQWMSIATSLLGVCIEDGYPRVLGSFYDSIFERYRAVPLPPQPNQARPSIAVSLRKLLHRAIVSGRVGLGIGITI